jgi:signal transduction histidine kinase
MPSVNGMTVATQDADQDATALVPRGNTFVRAIRQLGIDTQYVLLGFPIGIVALSLCMIGFSAGVGTVVTVLGLPILVATLFLARGLATIERSRIGPVLRRRFPQPHYKQAEEGAGFFRRMFRRLSDGQAWLDLVHGIFRFIPSTISFTFVIVWWVTAIGGLTFPLWDWAIPKGPDYNDLPELLGLGDSTAVRTTYYMALGVFFALTLIPVVRLSALLEAQFARGLLNGVNEIRERITEAEAGRDLARAQKNAAVSAEATALRRLERDIHDGPQQRLVRLAMDLGRAQQQAESDPAAAQATIAEALAQTRETLDELRALSRGIAPPILVDRGLKAALTALAGRCTVPVDLETPEVGRLDDAVETAAYFVVAESLTNVAKHSRANECRVVLERLPGALVVSITDDGVGGAHLAKGHGLTGLTDRVEATGGTLAVNSSVTIGTTVTATLPLREM